jgi:hypothetical protein
MTVESATYIDDLVPANTSSTTDPAEGGDQIALIKTVLQSTINLDAQVTATAAELNYLDITTLGTGEASKALTADALSNVDAGTLTWTNLGTITTAVINGGTITGITDLAVADGGTGASTASAARTNLGIVLGTDVQAYDADLAAIAGLTSAADKMIRYTGSGTAELVDSSSFTNTILTHEIADISTAETVYIPVPVTGTVVRVDTCLQGAITVADATVILTQSDDSVMASITVAFSGSAAGDIDSDTSISNASVTAGDYLKLATNGNSTTAAKLLVSLVIQSSVS